IFKKGDEVYKQFMDEYKVHTKGFFILGSSGSGKTHFVKNQKEKHWIDGDDLWMAAGASPLRPWWTEGPEVTSDVDRKRDIITQQAKKLGLWILGASNYWLIPDAIVIPDWELHKSYIIERSINHYDGGVREGDFPQVLAHRDSLMKIAEEKDIPVFSSVKEAADSLADTIK
ncbi:MAG: hypothetical protein ABIO02_00845, partial [Patescibacteria group bacterium]